MNIELTEEQAEAYNRGEAVEVTKPFERWKPNRHLLTQAEDEGAVSYFVDLLSYVREFGGDWVADWDDKDQKKYFVVYPSDCAPYPVIYCNRPQSFCEVYMSEECGIGLIEKIKSGEVVL